MGHLIELLVILMTCATARGGEPLPSWSEALDNDFEAEQSNSRHGLTASARVPLQEDSCCAMLSLSGHNLQYQMSRLPLSFLTDRDASSHVERR